MSSLTQVLGTWTVVFSPYDSMDSSTGMDYFWSSIETRTGPYAEKRFSLTCPSFMLNLIL